MSILFAEVEWVQKAIVKVDIAKFCRSDWADDRAAFVGTDAEFVIDALHTIGARDLLDPQDEDEQGITIEGEHDEGNITINGVA